MARGLALLPLVVSLLVLQPCRADEALRGVGRTANVSNVSLLQIHICDSRYADSRSRLQVRWSSRDHWQTLAGPLARNASLSYKLPYAAASEIQLRLLGEDGLCIDAVGLDGRSVTSGLPHWLDMPCTETAYGNIYCKSPATFNIEPPSSQDTQWRKLASHSICWNWQVLEVDEGSVETSLAQCAQRCLSHTECTHFTYATFSSCLTDRKHPPATCRILGGTCAQRPDPCWERYQVNGTGKGDNVGLRLPGEYVTYGADNMVYARASCSASAAPGHFVWNSTKDGTYGLQLVGASSVMGSSASVPVRGKVRKDGVIAWDDGRRSIPKRLMAKEFRAGANSGAGNGTLRVRTCDVEGAGTNSSIQFRSSAGSSWRYLGLRFERGEWKQYSLPDKVQTLQLRSTGDDPWCVDSVEFDRVLAWSGLPLWLESPPSCLDRNGTVCSDAGIVTTLGSQRQDFELIARGTGCKNWLENSLEHFTANSLEECAAKCRGYSLCSGFQFLPFTSCYDVSGGPWGSCRLWRGPCIPDHNPCWNQYRRKVPEVDHGKWLLTGAVVVVALICFGLGLEKCITRVKRAARDSQGRAINSLDDERSCVSGEAIGEDDSPARRCQDPAWAAISLEQLNELRDQAMKELGGDYKRATMHDINHRILQPLCGLYRQCYAHVVNGSNLRLVHVFVSHAWQENFEEFVGTVNAAFVHWPVKPNLWICATALIQSTDRSLVANQVGAGDDPREAPFTKALARAEKLLVVRNTTVDLYARIWCCWELFLAVEYGLVHRPGALMVTGPAKQTSFAEVDIEGAGASSPDDKHRILSHISRSQQGFELINQKLTEVKYFGKPRTPN